MSNASSEIPQPVAEAGLPPTQAGVQPAKRWPHPVVALLVTVGLFLAGQVVGGLVVAVLLSATGGSGSGKSILFDSPAMTQFIYAAVAYGSMLGGLLFFMRRTGMTDWRGLGLRWPKRSDPGWAIVGYLVYVLFYVLLVTVVAPLLPGLNVQQKQDTGFEGASGVLSLGLVFVALVILAPIVEELLMRGLLFGSLRRHLPFWLATLITSLVFGSFHLGGGESGAGLLWIAAIDTFVLSLVLCYLREKTGRLWAGIGLHMIKNCIAFTALFIIAK